LKILLIGYSNLAKKRIINFFKIRKIKFCVASKSYKKKINGAYEQFRSYREGLINSKADLVYISLPNSLHYIWAKKALQMGYHVVVDKPICRTYEELKNLINLSKRKKKLLVEATFFNYHQQIFNLIKYVKKNRINFLNSNFIIPKPKKGILISKKLGGGILMDMGPYISAIARIFFLKKLKSKIVIIKKDKHGLITSINFIFLFKNTIYTGCFMFGGSYKNELEVCLNDKSLKIERVFSPPDNQSLYLDINKEGDIKKIKIKKDNCFANFFSEIKLKVKSKKYSFYHKRIIDDFLFRYKFLK